MDGSSENTAVSNSTDDGVQAPDADGNPLQREGIATSTAAAQTAVLALMLLAEFDAVGSVPTTDYINGVLIVCGFAIASIYWAATWRPSGLGSACEEMVRRGLHVAALVFLASAASSLMRDAEGTGINAIKTFFLLVAVSWAGIGFQAILHQLSRCRGVRCVMIFGDGKTALELSRQVVRAMPSTKVCIWPVSAIPSMTTNLTQNSPVYAHPTIVELAPSVALISASASETAISTLASHLAPLAIDVLVDAPHRSRRLSGAVVSFAGISCLRVFPKPLSWHQSVVKRGFDIVVSSALIVLLSPLLCIIGLGIKLDSRGPVFFFQPRIGQNGAHFTIWKFRTMTTAASDVLAESPTVHNDPRLTRFGAILRKLSLDELPQLFNVLIGNMSLVGPRPHAMNGNQFDLVIASYAARHRVKPGITGLAQVSGWRGPTDTPTKIEQRVANDLRYIGEWSLAQDVSIICRTVFALYGKNAF